MGLCVLVSKTGFNKKSQKLSLELLLWIAFADYKAVIIFSLRLFYHLVRLLKFI